MYNKPAIKFRSGGFIVLMVIAWTALFHAIFFLRKIKPFYRKPNSVRYQKRENDYCYWELSACLKEYYKTDVENPVKKNLELFIPLRNIIEHKSLPEIDPTLFAECQAMLINYDRILGVEFGASFCLRESLSFSLQLFPSSKTLSAAIKSNKDLKSVVKFIDNYRSSLTTDTLESGQYAFKAFLLQVSNHQSKEALPVQFIRYDLMNDEEKKNAKRFAALLKEKIVEKPVTHHGLILPSKVIEAVQSGLGNPFVLRNGLKKSKFNSDTHTRCWKKYKVRPNKRDKNPNNTIDKYCIYDKLSGQYGYTNEWVSFLVEKMSNDEEYNSLYNTQVD
jgi:hypothetical protein